MNQSASHALSPTKAPITPGGRRAFLVPGTAVVVTVANNSRPGAPTWNVITSIVGFRSDAYSRGYTCETTARAEARRLVRSFYANAHHGATAPAGLGDIHPEELTIALAAAAKGTQTRVSGPGLVALQNAINAGGYLRRGGGHGLASVTLLQSLAKRGHLDLDVQLQGRRKVVKGGRITRLGRIAVLCAIGADPVGYALSA